MRGSGCTRLLVISLVLLISPLALGQSDRLNSQPDAVPLLPRISPVPNPSQPIVFPRPAHSGPIGFPQIAHAAGTIFSGTVTAITRHPTTRRAMETVAVTFHVEQAVRGATPGEDLTISQWMGVWSSGQRYRVGERVLLFLYPPSKLGLTSLVGGELGRFYVDPWGRVLLNAQHLSVFRNDPILGGKSRVRVSDLAAAVRRVSQEESQ